MTPYEFYGTVIPISKIIRFKLGYFSSNAISTIAPGFARFIFHNGKADFAINQFLRPKDYELLKSQKELTDLQFKQIESKTNNLDQLHEILKEANNHFYNCLRYLMEKGDLNIIPVTCADGGLSHYKEAIFYDSTDKEKANKIHINGSCNFTQSGIIENGESFDVRRSWTNEENKEYISVEENKFDELFKGEATDEYIYLSKDQLEKAIYTKGANKDIDELLDDEIKLRTKIIKKEKLSKAFEKFELDLKKEIQIIKTTPRFPGGFEPYDYQNSAYQSWANPHKSNYKGIFAMATGTGKTFTSLNCVLNEYNLTNEYYVIILVPTTILVNQWVNDVKAFNFKNIVTSNDNNWVQSINRIHLKISLNKDANFVFISTYATYNKSKFQNVFKRFNNDKLILIADEVHNLGSKKSIKNLLMNINKRIGLSATPSRKYDSEGSSEIEKYFNSYSPCYTYSYSMFKAIEERRLTKYKYYPYFTTLSREESNSYQKISKELLKHFDFKKGTYRKSAEMLLIKRKRIIHQAINKKTVIKKIIENLKSNDENLKHVIVYVPEGFDPDYSKSDNYDIEKEDLRIINDYSKIISNCGLTTHQVLGETRDRERVLEQFEKGDISILTAMKTLDEGVDIPATKYAIFCSSTGNPRQFIQRRGRILRKFTGKEFAFVYDIIVKPNNELFKDLHPNVAENLRKMEENIFRSEIDRVANFLYAADNIGELLIRSNNNMKELANLCRDYEIDIYQLIRDLENADKNCQ